MPVFMTTALFPVAFSLVVFCLMCATNSSRFISNKFGSVLLIHESISASV